MSGTSQETSRGMGQSTSRYIQQETGDAGRYGEGADRCAIEDPVSAIRVAQHHPLSRVYWCGEIAFELETQFQMWRLISDIHSLPRRDDSYVFNRHLGESGGGEEVVPGWILQLRHLLSIVIRRQTRPGGKDFVKFIENDLWLFGHRSKCSVTDRSSCNCDGGLKRVSQFVRLMGQKYKNFYGLIRKLVSDLEIGDISNYSSTQLLPVRTLFLTNYDLLVYKKVIIAYIISVHQPKELLEPPPQRNHPVPGGYAPAGAAYAPAGAAYAPAGAAPARPTIVKKLGGIRIYRRDEIEFGRIIGSGGFGHVYKALLNRQQKVAIKLFRGPTPDQDVYKEIIVLSKLSHPNLVKLEGVCVNPLGIIFELCELGTLHQLVHYPEKKIPTKQKIQLLIQIGEGIRYLHDKKVIHRDIKPLNILLAAQGASCSPKLCDFGLTNHIKGDCTHVSMNKNHAGGSPRYMAPECYDTAGVINESVDIWAFACVIMETLTGQYPFQSIKDANQIMKELLVNKSPPFGNQLVELIQGKQPYANNLKNVIKNCFQFNQRSRPDIRQILGALLGNTSPGENDF
ncbi:protein kinase [Gregarina niphandrodes]|uniref:Protein kinase n=1 Tax=Gregarina niphandrodes TaxID=110365 RepID=A0A023BBL1_GRENI|nr:protein kinase [Gregarina niphandrodes]EZG79958.1 protein kinase [Gregarina niphandrodes]|eukprot:XP_011134349.1 protein kinase [Gregarina niphandrodes]